MRVVVRVGQRGEDLLRAVAVGEAQARAGGGGLVPERPLPGDGVDLHLGVDRAVQRRAHREGRLVAGDLRGLLDEVGQQRELLDQVPEAEEVVPAQRGPGSGVGDVEQPPGQRELLGGDLQLQLGVGPGRDVAQEVTERREPGVPVDGVEHVREERGACPGQRPQRGVALVGRDVERGLEDRVPLVVHRVDHGHQSLAGGVDRVREGVHRDRHLHLAEARSVVDDDAGEARAGRGLDVQQEVARAQRRGRCRPAHIYDQLGELA